MRKTINERLSLQFITVFRNSLRTHRSIFSYALNIDFLQALLPFAASMSFVVIVDLHHLGNRQTFSSFSLKLKWIRIERRQWSGNASKPSSLKRPNDDDECKPLKPFRIECVRRELCIFVSEFSFNSFCRMFDWPAISAANKTSNNIFGNAVHVQMSKKSRNHSE